MRRRGSIFLGGSILKKVLFILAWQYGGAKGGKRRLLVRENMIYDGSKIFWIFCEGPKQEAGVRHSRGCRLRDGRGGLCTANVFILLLAGMAVLRRAYSRVHAGCV